MLFGVLPLVAGCFSAPTRPEGVATDAPEHGDSGVGDVPMLTVTPGIKLAIGTSDYTMTFEAGGWQLPVSLVMNAAPTQERLSFTQSYDENAIGVTLWPAYTVNSGALALNATATRTVVNSGPAKATVDIRWNGPEHCAGTGMLVDNLSRLTFFPDGRIARHDEVKTQMACGNNLGTLNAFVWGSDMRAFYGANGASSSFQNPPSSESFVSLGRAATGTACLQDAASAIGFTWIPEADPEWEKIEIQLLPDTFGAALFWAEDVDTVNGKTYVANTTLVVRGRGTQCSDLGPFLAAWQKPPSLTNATYRPDGGVYVLASLGTVTAQADLPSGFVLEYPTTADASTVTIERTSAVAARSRSLVAGVDYLVQSDGTSLTWFIVDTLFTGEQLVLSQ